MSGFTRVLGVFLPLVLMNVSCTKCNKESTQALPSAQSKTGQTFKEAADQTLNLGNGAEPKEIDPALVTGEPDGNVVFNIFEGLVTLDNDTLEPQPAVAESWTISPDGKTYTFKIRKNAKWSDGSELTAEDFVWSWTRVLTPMTASEYAYQLYYVKNGEDFNKGKIKDPNMLGLKAPDKYTFVVELAHPTPFFLKLCAFYTLNPTPKQVVTKFPGQEWTKEENIVSNGPYKLVEWKLNRHIKAVPNEYYWDKDAVKLKEIYFYPIENSDTEEKMFLSGKLHLTNTVPPLRIPKYEEEAKKMGADATYRAFPQLASYFYRFNVKRKPVDDWRVRRALALTIDRTALVKNILHAGQVPATSFTPPVHGYSFKGDLPETVTPAAIAEAKKLLAEAGYPDGKGMEKIEIHYNTLEAHKKIAVAIQSMWKTNLGIDVGLFNQEWKVYLDTQVKMDFTVSRAGWVADYPDPNTFLDMFVTGGGNNKTNWSNKDYDHYIEQAGQTMDEAKRFDYFHKAEAILLKELPVLPIYFYTRPRLATPLLKRIVGGKYVVWVPNVIDRTVYKNFVLVEKI